MWGRSEEESKVTFWMVLSFIASLFSFFNREDWLKEKKKPDGTVRSGPPQKPITSEKRDLLAKQLHKKVDKVSHKGKKVPEGNSGGGRGRGRGRGK